MLHGRMGPMVAAWAGLLLGAVLAVPAVGPAPAPLVAGVVLAAGFTLAIPRQPRLPVATWSGLALATAVGLALFARPATQLLGDGQLIAHNFQLALDGSRDVIVHSARSILAHERVSPLASLLHLAAVRGVGASEAAPALVAESLWLGLLLLGLLAGLLRWSRLPGGLGAWCTLVVLGSPALLLYLGYVENYTAAHLLLGLYTMAAVAGLAGRLHPAWPTGLLLLATGFHLQALAWWPSLLLLWWRHPWLVRHGGPAIGLASLAAGGVVAMWDPAGVLLPHKGPGLTLWSGAHLGQWLGGLLLVFPLLPLLPWARWMAGRGAPVALADSLLWPSLVLTFFLDPELGAARDWDRLAFVQWPLGLVLLLAIRAAGEPWAGRTLAPATAIALVATVGWVGTHADAARSVAWVEAAVRDDPHAHEHGYEALAEYHARHGDWPAAARFAEAAWRASGNPRLAVLAAQHRLRTGEEGPARGVLEAALSRHPADHRVRHELLRLVARTGDEDGVMALAAKGMRLHPTEPVYPYFAAEGELRRGRLAQARVLFGRSLALPGLPPEARRYAEAQLGRRALATEGLTP